MLARATDVKNAARQIGGGRRLPNPGHRRASVRAHATESAARQAGWGACANVNSTSAFVRFLGDRLSRRHDGSEQPECLPFRVRQFGWSCGLRHRDTADEELEERINSGDPSSGNELGGEVRVVVSARRALAFTAGELEAGGEGLQARWAKARQVAAVRRSGKGAGRPGPRILRGAGAAADSRHEPAGEAAITARDGAGRAGHFGIVRPPVDRRASRAPVGRALVGLGIMVMAMTRIDEFADCSDVGQARKSGGASNSARANKT